MARDAVRVVARFDRVSGQVILVLDDGGRQGGLTNMTMTGWDPATGEHFSCDYGWYRQTGPATDGEAEVVLRRYNQRYSSTPGFQPATLGKRLVR